ncbi:MAG TPA: EutN/CcmL family microcompartment protein [Pirellulales bacterium]|jgi:ethanolamine utilization protein EutN|nr:EutN/CcmL family microcompartment protein [Pirellulales bacterium]
MQLGLVLGTATSTVKHPSLEGRKILVVQCYGPDRATPDGEPLLAVDSLGAGVGQQVIVSSDGKATRALLGSETTPVRWCVLGIQD